MKKVTHILKVTAYILTLLLLAANIGLQVYNQSQLNERLDFIEKNVSSTLDSFYNYVLTTGETDDYE